MSGLGACVGASEKVSGLQHSGHLEMSPPGLPADSERPLTQERRVIAEKHQDQQPVHLFLTLQATELQSLEDQRIGLAIHLYSSPVITPVDGSRGVLAPATHFAPSDLSLSSTY